MKKWGMILFIICLLASFVSADSDYWMAGSNESQFNRGRGIFSLVDELDTAYYTAGLSDAYGIPLIADLDGDGIMEIYVIDDDDIEVYEGIDLEYQSGFDYGTAQRHSYPIIFDIDGDGTEEYIMFLEQDKQMLVLNFSGSVLTNETTYDIAFTYSSGETIIACRDVNDCMIAYSLRPDSCATFECADLGVMYFNYTQSGNPTLLKEVGGVGGQNYAGFCRPSIPYIAVADSDIDGDKDYILSFAQIADADGSEDYGIYVSWVDMTNKVATEIHNYFIEPDVFQGLDNFQVDDAIYCYNEFDVGSSFTSPLVNQHLQNDGGYETVIAYVTGTDEFKMIMFDKDGQKYSLDYPPADDSNGILVSNVFMADIFPEESTVGKTFCVVGWDNDEDEQVLTCGSAFKSGYDTAEYAYDITDGYDVYWKYKTANNIAHSTQQDNTLTDGIDLDEFTSTYGIFSVDDDSCSTIILTGKDLCSANRVFQNGLGLSAVVTADIEGTGLEDMLALGNKSLVLFDDGISNQPVSTVDAYFNPCPTNTIIKLNETMIITVTGYDGNSDYSLEDDLLTYNVTVYKGTDNELNDTETGVDSGSPRQFSFTLNKTIASGIIEVLVTDNVNDPLTIEQSFTVGQDGILFGDVTCTLSTTTEEAEGTSCDVDGDCDSGEACVDGVCTAVSEECDDDSDCPTGYACVNQPDGTKSCMSINLLKRSADEFAGLMGVSSLVVWLLIMILINIVIVYEAHKDFSGMSAKYLLAIIAGVDLLWIVIGVIASVIGLWLIILLILFAIILGVVFVAQKIQGSGV